MRNYIFIICLTSISMVGFSQDYWSKTYDPFDHEAEDVRNILIEDSIIYASSRGSCRKDSVAECAKLVKFNLKGDYLDGFENPLFETGYGFESDDDWLYVDGGNEPYNDKIFVSRTSKDFAQNEIVEVSIDSSILLVNQSSASTDQYIISYGTYDDTTLIHDNGKNQVNGVQVWVNKETFTVDTIIHLYPTRWFRSIYDMLYDGKNHVYVTTQL